MQTVFFNQTAIYFTELNQPEKAHTVFIRSKSDMHRFLDRFFNTKVENDISLAGTEIKQLHEFFISYFKIVKAAGGVVKNNNGQFLMIKRHGIWDLPKGKLAKKENPEECALREVSEETGVEGLELRGKLPPTWHVYFRNDKFVLKETHWYRMHTSFSKTLKPQLEEDISEAIWMHQKECTEALKTGYRSLRDILIPYITE